MADEIADLNSQLNELKVSIDPHWPSSLALPARLVWSVDGQSKLGLRELARVAKQMDAVNCFIGGKKQESMGRFKAYDGRVAFESR